ATMGSHESTTFMGPCPWGWIGGAAERRTTAAPKRRRMILSPSRPQIKRETLGDCLGRLHRASPTRSAPIANYRGGSTGLPHRMRPKPGDDLALDARLVFRLPFDPCGGVVDGAPILSLDVRCG